MEKAVEFKVPVGAEGRADKILAEAFPETSRSLIKRSIEAGKTFRKNGVSLEPKSKLETHTVETHVYRLRKKVESKFNDKFFIISSKNGYKVTN